ncbi:MAG TPA: dTMP kinase [Candidatus Andersenbacteria bacterium]|nr:dTMP kinase [Candidatus Andersenbacteria bacterium]
MFIVIESIDAAGGSTQAKLLADRLQKTGYDVLSLHFPQEDAPTGQLIYEKFLRNKNKLKLTRREQALLYIQDFFSRAEDIREHLQKSSPPARGGARGGGRAIVSDRFYGSTLAYQTIGLVGQHRRRVIDWIKALCEQGQPNLPKPDLVIFLDTPVSLAAEHLKKRPKDFFENQRKQQAIRRSYRMLAREERWTIINSADEQGNQRSIKDIHTDIWSAIAS